MADDILASSQWGKNLGRGFFFKKRSEWYKNFSEKRAEIGTANDLPEIPEI